MAWVWGNLCLKHPNVLTSTERGREMKKRRSTGRSERSSYTLRQVHSSRTYQSEGEEHELCNEEVGVCTAEIPGPAFWLVIDGSTAPSHYENSTRSHERMTLLRRNSSFALTTGREPLIHARRRSMTACISVASTNCSGVSTSGAAPKG